MASLGGASASLQPALPSPARRRLVVIGMAGVAATLLGLIIVISVSLSEESGPEAAATVATARAGLPGTELSAEPLLGSAVPVGLVAVAAGTYPVGCDPKRDTGCFDDEQPRHEAKLERYGIMRHEVTVGEYRRCVAEGECDEPGQGPGCSFGSRADPSLPVSCVTFAEAQAYCRFRSLRLPTESEWEVAARGPGAKRFPWGEGRPSCEGTVVGGCGHRGPRPVGSKSTDRSWVGAFDLGGNVREWTASDYGAYPGGRRDRDRVGKITRGTSYRIAPADADTSYNRGVDEPAQARPDLGFRCAASL